MVEMVSPGYSYWVTSPLGISAVLPSVGNLVELHTVQLPAHVNYRQRNENGENTTETTVKIHYISYSQLGIKQIHLPTFEHYYKLW